MGWWSEQILPRAVDRVLRAPAVAERRRLVCGGLAGRVVELGFGSGLNIAFYPAEVTEVLAVEPSDVAWRLSEARRLASPATVVRAGLDGQRLDLPDASVDAALSTFTLCTVPDLSATLSEVCRVLRPGGRLHFLEHGRAPEPSVQAWQRRLNPVQSRLAGGCHLDRPIDAMIAAAGMEVTELLTEYGEGPRPFSFGYLGSATKPA